MLRRLKRSVAGAAAIVCITQFLYHLIELSTLNITNTEQQHQLYSQQPLTDFASETEKNDYLFRGQFRRDSSNTSKSLLTHLTLTSLDRYAEVYTNSHHKPIGTVITGQHLGPTNASDMSPGGSDARLPATCPSVGLPTMPGSTPAWQVVVPDHSYVFSGFIERRVDRREIKVIGTSDTRKRGKPNFCQIWFKNYSYPVVVNAVDEIVPETHNKRFAVFLYRCDLMNVSTPPLAVSLTQEKCDVANNIVAVAPTRTKRRQTTFTVCVSPLQNHFNEAHILVEFIEIHRIFGAEKFVFYNMSIGPDVRTFLEYYKQQAIADVIPWKLPSRVDAHYHAQLASLNDCLYRYMYRSKYIAFLDLDEILVPRVHKTWNKLMSSLVQIPYTAKLCAFVFQCVFFRTNWPDSPSSRQRHAIKHHNVISLLKTKREPEAWPHLQRSKLIVNPRKVDIMGIHNIWKPLRDYMEYDVPNKTAALHHYRRWDDTRNQKWVIDDTMFTYATPLLERIHLVKKKVRFRGH